jgi:hypothetical protein
VKQTRSVLKAEVVRDGWSHGGVWWCKMRGKTYLDFLNIAFLQNLLDDIVGVLGAKFIFEECV